MNPSGFALLCALCVLALNGFAAAKPNIVFIIADDLGYGDVQCLNPERGKISTPHLDRLAAQGMAFTDAHSGSSVCTPTRYGLMTGRYAWRTRLQRGVLDGGNDEPLIAADRLTVAGFLKQHGYATACIGKWHLGFQSDATSGKGAKQQGKRAAGLPVGARIIGGPTTRGFDEFWGCSNARTMSSLINGDRVVEDLPTIEMLPRLTQRAVDYLGARATAAKAGQPFFLYVPLTSPHTPIVPSKEWQGKSPLGAYGDFVMQTDDTVGRILAALDQHGLADNTLVLMTSDNGCSPAAGTPKLEAQGHFASASFRGYKADIWEGGHRVPFLARWPAVVKPGGTSGATICLVDFMATTAEIVGAKLPASAAPDSVSFLSALRGTPIVTERKAIVHHSINGLFAVREGQWKLNLCPGSGGWGKPGDADAVAQGLPSVQLYDMIADTAESKNLAAAHPEIVARLRGHLESYIAEGRSTPGAKQANDTEVSLAKPDRKPKKKK